MDEDWRHGNIDESPWNPWYLLDISHFDADHVSRGTETYLSQDAGADNLLSRMGAQICVDDPDVIYFAVRRVVSGG
ncbi:hypothetical protein ACFYXQ_05110 [Nocardia jiangxiensis]|uniref:Uncharacterized protein n=1 Tax=Nocardia jiangxiensis TaxID=282685 RepID=A0ABW6RSZ6_9NOCA